MFSRRLLAVALLLAAGGCMKPVDAPPVSVVFFTTFSTELDSEAKQVLERVAADARASPRRVIVIQGFADPTVTSPAQGKSLAEQRALAVSQGLVANGVAENRMILRPRGSSQSDPGVESRRVDISFAP